MSLHISTLQSSPPIARADVASPTGQTTQSDFGRVMSDALADTLSAVRSAEETSVAALQGKASIQEVVETVMHAERQLQTILAIRDKVVGAYQELNRTTM